MNADSNTGNSDRLQPVLIAGEWVTSTGIKSFCAEDPARRRPLPDRYPVSDWDECRQVLDAACQAAAELRETPGSRLAAFLRRFAERIEESADELVSMAATETGLPVEPRLAGIELPRTTGQLRQAADAAESGSWRMAVIDRAQNIRSWLTAIGPVAVFGPNNFPFAFGSVSGGDFAAAIAAGNPVIGKANSSHPGTTRLFAEQAVLALGETGLPAGSVQLLYRLDHPDGLKLVSDARLGATGYTGSRRAGLALKAAADQAGKPIYLELSSVNPVLMLPGAIKERGDDIVDQFVVSCLMGAGQFCTNPGLVFLLAGSGTEQFLATVAERFQTAPGGTLLSAAVQASLETSLQRLEEAGATCLAGGTGSSVEGADTRYCSANTLLSVPGSTFLNQPIRFQEEAFGNASLAVIADDAEQLAQILDQLEGNLTGTVYSALNGEDDRLYQQLAPRLEPSVGRLLNDKMPTGVAISPAMNHGGPYPATGHPGFTAVGIPAAIRRFCRLQCYDNVRHDRLPDGLRDPNPNGLMWRCVDDEWTRGDVT